MNNPKVTVLMPVFNGEKFLAQAIESILHQTFTDFEFLIINDGSTDGSEKIIQQYKDPRIVYVKNDKNVGIINTLNKGIQLAKGNYIARMDCDDLSVPERLEKQVQFLNSHPEHVLVASKIILIDEQGKRQGYWEDDIRTTTYEEIKNYLPKLNCIAHPSVMFRKTTAVEYLYDPKQKNSEDWDLWLRLLSDHKKIEKLDEVLLMYRIHSQSITYNANQKNVHRKIFKVQKNFFLKKLRQGKISKIEKQVFKHSFESFDKAYLKGRIKKYSLRTGKYINKKIIRKIKGYFIFLNVLSKLRQHENKSGLFFFFPFYHVGGAERVHIDILNTVKDQKPWIFITNRSDNKAFYNEFKKNGELFYIGEMGSFRKKIWIKAIAKIINKHPSPLLFGCNSSFFYNLIPEVKQEAKIIDLIHAFSGKDYKGAEDWSLPVIPRLHKRIFINQKSIEDLKNQYKENNIDPKYTQNVEYIPNYTPIPEKYIEKSTGEIEVLYVGRGSEEKRIHLIGQIAKKCNERNLPINFTIAGNVKDSLPSEYHSYFKLAGEISDAKILNRLYSNAHIILITSRREGMPMVIMEGMAHGVVPVCTTVGDIPVHVQQGKTGYTVDNQKDPEEIVSTMVEILQSLHADRSLLQTLSKNAYAYAKENFGRENFEKAYKKLFNK